MAIGFTPKHIENYPLNGLTHEQYLALAFETVEKLAWKVAYLSESGLIAHTDNGMFHWNAEIKITIQNDTANIVSASTGNDMMDWGKNKKNVLNFLSNFETLKSTFTDDEIKVKYEHLTQYFVPKQEDILILPPPTATQQIKDFFSIFVPTQDFFVTPILMNLNILVFLLMAISGVNIMSPDSESLINWGANFKPNTLDGQWWRLFTNCFLHIGIIHLLMNMYALLYVGILLEPILGKARFLSSYLLTGIAASMVSLWWHDLTVSAGASGAIFGMYGVFLALLTTKLIEENARKALLTSIAVFVVFNLLNGLKGGIDNAAHIGGLLSGLLVGYAFIISLKNFDNKQLKYRTIGLLTFVTIAASFVLYKKIPNDIGIYSKKMEQFSSMEKKALEVYNLPQDTPNDKLLNEFKTKSIYCWNENIKLTQNIEKLNLPDNIQKRNLTLKKYAELRLNCCELTCKSIAENTDKYNSEINNCNNQIEEILKDLNSEQDGK
jgi:rhomboid protease GluP